MQCAKCLSLLRITQSGKTCLYSRERALPSTARAGQAFVPTGAGFDPSKNRPLQCLRQQNSATKIKARPFFLYYSLWLLRSSSRSVILKAKCVLQLPGVLAYRVEKSRVEVSNIPRHTYLKPLLVRPVSSSWPCSVYHKRPCNRKSLPLTHSQPESHRLYKWEEITYKKRRLNNRNLTNSF